MKKKTDERKGKERKRRGKKTERKENEDVRKKEKKNVDERKERKENGVSRENGQRQEFSVYFLSQLRAPAKVYARVVYNLSKFTVATT